jgi:hypothetical protein
MAMDASESQETVELPSNKRMRREELTEVDCLTQSYDLLSIAHKKSGSTSIQHLEELNAIIFHCKEIMMNYTCKVVADTELKPPSTDYKFHPHVVVSLPTGYSPNALSRDIACGHMPGIIRRITPRLTEIPRLEQSPRERLIVVSEPAITLPNSNGMSGNEGIGFACVQDGTSASPLPSTVGIQALEEPVMEEGLSKEQYLVLESSQNDHDVEEDNVQY